MNGQNCEQFEPEIQKITDEIAELKKQTDTLSAERTKLVDNKATCNQDKAKQAEPKQAAPSPAEDVQTAEELTEIFNMWREGILRAAEESATQNKPTQNKPTEPTRKGFLSRFSISKPKPQQKTKAELTNDYLQVAASLFNRLFPKSEPDFGNIIAQMKKFDTNPNIVMEEKEPSNILYSIIDNYFNSDVVSELVDLPDYPYFSRVRMWHDPHFNKLATFKVWRRVSYISPHHEYMMTEYRNKKVPLIIDKKQGGGKRRNTRKSRRKTTKHRKAKRRHTMRPNTA
jgi:hypothetical protein